MKRIFMVLTLILMALPIVNCAPKGDKKSSVRVGRTARGYSDAVNAGTRQVPSAGENYDGGQSSVGIGKSWGGVYIDQQNQWVNTDYLFNENVHDFVAAHMNPQDLGSVSGQMNATTGIRFWATASTGQPVNPNGNNNISINGEGSELRIVIWDSYAGYIDSNGELITEVPVHIRGTAWGNVTGNRAVIRFQDQYGWIELNGQFDSNYFQGTMFFDNTNGAANYLGRFYVPTCGFFRCY